MRERILIVALAKDWTGISRLPQGLQRAGFHVFALCPRGSFLSRTRYLDGIWTYPAFTYTRTKLIYLFIFWAIRRFKPDVLIPGDEDAVLALQKFSQFRALGSLKRSSALVRGSLSSPHFDSLLLSKSQFMEACQGWGVLAPRNVRVRSLQEALDHAAAPEFGYPVVLKYDYGYGASGVFICPSEDELVRAFCRLQSRTLARRLKDFIKRQVYVTESAERGTISLQKFVRGQVGQAPFCAEKGRVFAVNAMLKYRTHPGETGPTSVAKGIELPEIIAAVKTIAEKLHFTGIGSLDYIIEEATQRVFVIELNPRPTPTCHLGADLCAVDICKSFYEGLNGGATEERPFRPFLIALFPNEQKRDAQSPFLREAFHDVPQNDPDLVSALLGR